MLALIDRIGLILREARRLAKQANRCAGSPAGERRLEVLEERVAPAVGNALQAQGRLANLSPGQVATSNPGVTIPSPAPTRSGNQTSAAGAAQLQNVNDATLFFNNTLVTLAPPAPLPLPPPSTSLFLPTINAGALGSPAPSAALSSLGTLNASQPLYASSFAAFIAVRSAASASVPGSMFTGGGGSSSRYPTGEETQEETVNRVALDYVWSVAGSGLFSQAAPLEGLINLVSVADQLPPGQLTFP